MNSLTDLAIHPDTKAALTAYIEKPAHAVALIGNKGLGKSILARAVSAAVLGKSEADLRNYPYILAITPLDGSISIEQVRQISGFFMRTTPSTTKREISRVLLLEDADCMTKAAQNAFLKLLEEPPADTICILTLSRLEELLPTVRSRFQKIHIHTPSPLTIVGLLAEQLGIEDRAVERALMLTGGNIAETYRLLTNVEGATVDTSVSLVKTALTGDTFTRLALVDGLINDKLAAERFLATLIVFAEAGLHQSTPAGLEKLKRWQRILQAAQIAQTAFARKANSKLVFTELMLSM